MLGSGFQSNLTKSWFGSQSDAQPAKYIIRQECTSMEVLDCISDHLWGSVASRLNAEVQTNVVSLWYEGCGRSGYGVRQGADKLVTADRHFLR